MIVPAVRTWSDTPEREDSFTNVTALNDDLYNFFIRNGFGGICLFAQNLEDTAQTVRLTDQLQNAARLSGSGIPMFIAVDQEGGNVRRLMTGTTGIGNMALGAAGKTDYAFEEAEIFGEEIKALGLNLDLAPVVDVNNNPANPVIGIRSFSDDPKVVAEYAQQFILGLHEQGVMACMKHFPGHGDTETDSHTGLPRIEKTLDEVLSCELIPYKENCTNADMVMTAHIQFPMIEQETYKSISSGQEIQLPATLSHTIVTGLLRNKLGFDGVVITDALGMEAISVNFDRKDTARLAINAGVDLLLNPVDINKAEDLYAMESYLDDMVAMAERGEISEREINDSVARILAMKYRYGLFESPVLSVEELVENALKVVGSKEHHIKEWEMALDAVTQVQGSDDSCPKITDDTRVLCFVPADNTLNSVEIAKNRLLQDGVIRSGSNITAESFEEIREDRSAAYEEQIKEADEIIVITEFSNYKASDPETEGNVAARFISGVVDLAKKNGKRVIVISSKSPYDARRYPAADAVFLAYNPKSAEEVPLQFDGNTKTYGANIPAALVIALTGMKAKGTCPVQIP